MAHQPGQTVFLLGQFNLKLAFPAACPLGENIQNQGGAIHNGKAHRILNVAQLAGSQFMVKNQKVCFQRCGLAFDLLEHAASDTGGFVYGGTFLADFAQHNSAGSFGQLA